MTIYYHPNVSYPFALYHETKKDKDERGSALLGCLSCLLLLVLEAFKRYKCTPAQALIASCPFLGYCDYKTLQYSGETFLAFLPYDESDTKRYLAENQLEKNNKKKIDTIK